LLYALRWKHNARPPDVELVLVRERNPPVWFRQHSAFKSPASSRAMTSRRWCCVACAGDRTAAMGSRACGLHWCVQTLLVFVIGGLGYFR
jgi:hypothetical protein